MKYTHRHALGHCWIFSFHSWYLWWFPIHLHRGRLDHPDKTSHVEQMGKRHWVVWAFSLRLDIVWNGAPKEVWYE
ncbi:hypothetical protein LCGC14_1754490 [marine sediment metagenome]|uniref:Uncharacterized protein n=1 Tax=marine sediment metagenome TaxID=412755 RepID=A0A0F9H2Z0_9ZZZZ